MFCCCHKKCYKRIAKEVIDQLKLYEEEKRVDLLIKEQDQDNQLLSELLGSSSLYTKKSE
jgi:hypothetical protein